MDEFGVLDELYYEAHEADSPGTDAESISRKYRVFLSRTSDQEECCFGLWVLSGYTRKHWWWSIGGAQGSRTANTASLLWYYNRSISASCRVFETGDGHDLWVAAFDIHGHLSRLVTSSFAIRFSVRYQRALAIFEAVRLYFSDNHTRNS